MAEFEKLPSLFRFIQKEKPDKQKNIKNTKKR